MNIFITGATGYIGGQLARLLVAKGHTLTALVRSPEKAGQLGQMGIRLHPGDITEIDSLRLGMQGADAIFHVAAWYKIGATNAETVRLAERVNVEGTRNVLTVMQELGIPKGVYTSTLAIYSDTHGEKRVEGDQFTGKHLSVYDRTKAEAHQVAKEFIAAGLPLVIVQPGLVYGPDDPSNAGDTLRQYLQRQLPMIPQQTGYCWAHIDDVVEGHWLALEKGQPGQSYHISGPAHTLVEALQIAKSITGIPVPMAAPPWVFSTMSGLTGLVDSFLPLPDIYTAEGLRVIAGPTYYGENSKARQELGFNPRPLEEGLRTTLAHEMRALGIA